MCAQLLHFFALCAIISRISGSETNLLDFDPSRSNHLIRVKQSTNDYYRRIIEEAPHIPAETTYMRHPYDIPWLDRQLVKEGIEFSKRYYMTFYTMVTAATLFGLAFKPITGVLIRYGPYDDPKYARKLHESRLLRVLSWFDENTYAPENAMEKLANTRGPENYNFVRRKHDLVVNNTIGTPLPKFVKRVGDESKEFIEALRADLEFVEMSPPLDLLTWNPVVPLSQFSMVATQFAGIGPILIKKQADFLGIKDQRGLEGYMHIQALIGRMMGIEDRFNLGLHATPEFCEKFFTNVMLPSTKMTDEIVVTLQESFLKGMGSSSANTTLISLTFQALKSSVPNFEGQNLKMLLKK